MKKQRAIVGRNRGLGIFAVAALLSFATAALADDAPKPPAKAEATQPSLSAKQIATQKLNSIVLNHLELEDVAVPAILKELEKQSIDLDPAKKGVKLTFIPDPKQAKNPPTVTLALGEVTLGEALKFVSLAAKLKLQVHESGVVILRQLSPAELNPSGAGAR